MRRPIRYRVLISLWAVWFSTALIEPAGFFACRMHSGIVGAPAAPAAEPTDPDHDGHSCCTCLGQCSTMTAAVVPQVDITIAELLSRQASVAASVVLSRIPLRPAHALPFANGPPTPVRA